MVGFKETELKVERVAAYVRVSTQEQKLHGLSLDAQRMKLTQYAEEHNMRIVGWYVDEGVSGRKLIRRRPELQRMIQDAEAGKFDRIIFIKLDRFFRSVAEYHECMKRIAPVIWTTTEEDYDLSTANGRMLVNMKLTIAEMEADQTGERIKIVNEYKVQTGQPLVGDQSQPLGFKNAINPANGRKMVIRDPDEEEIVYDLINNFLTHQSKRRTMIYIHTKYHISIPYKAITNLLSNTMLYGEYRGNPSYCEAYIDKETFDKIQDILSRNVKSNTVNRAYIFSGLIKCPRCGRQLKGGIHIYKRGEKEYRYKKYRCGKYRIDVMCDWSKSVSENKLERLMLSNIEQYLADAKIHSVQVSDSETPQLSAMDVDEIHAEIDRLNYSWRTGKIRTVEQYESQYDEMMERLAQAEAMQGQTVAKDFSKIEAILHDGWRAIYDSLDDSYKRAFWRSFVKSIELDWDGEDKAIKDVTFF
jgi:DNA invertase Pin-like site-specific DNA recombinase